MIRASTCVAAMVALAGCGDPSPPPAPAPAEPSAFQNQVAALSDGERNIVLIRAIRDAGHDCQGVVQSARSAAPAAGDPVYTARCTDGASYGVVIGRDGTAQVVGAR